MLFDTLICIITNQLQIFQFLGEFDSLYYHSKYIYEISMNKRVLNIDEIASIRNKHWKQLDEQYRKNHPGEEIPRESEPSDEESDLCIVVIENKEYYKDLDDNIYEIKKDNQIGIKNQRLKTLILSIKLSQ